MLIFLEWDICCPVSCLGTAQCRSYTSPNCLPYCSISQLTKIWKQLKRAPSGMFFNCAWLYLIGQQESIYKEVPLCDGKPMACMPQLTHRVLSACTRAISCHREILTHPPIPDFGTPSAGAVVQQRGAMAIITSQAQWGVGGPVSIYLLILPMGGGGERERERERETFNPCSAGAVVFF